MLSLTKLAAWSVPAFAALLFFSQMVAHAGGYRIGRLNAARREVSAEGVSVLVGAFLGLLTFVLALTLNFATSRFYDLRQGTLAEANAIGTAALRAKAVGGQEGDAIARELEEYARLRRDFVAALHEGPSLNSIDARTNVLQGEIWTEVTAIVRAQPTPVNASLMNAVNEVFDTTTAERLLYDLHLPENIFWLMIVMALIGSGTVGYQMAIKGRDPLGLSVLLMLIWTLVTVDILDLGAPRLGGIRTSVSAYEWTLEAIRALPSQ